MKRWMGAMMLAMTGVLLAGCGQEQQPTMEIREDTYTVRGEVESVRQGDQTELLIRHEAIDDFKDLLSGEVVGMKSMTMPFGLEDASLAEGVEPGDKVSFTFKTTRSGAVVTSIEELPADTQLNFAAIAQPADNAPAHDDHAGHNH